jgi:phosphate transport system substrate-binding protein
VRSLIDREVASFAKLYPEAHFRVMERSSNGAVRALFAAQCDVAAVGRDLTPEERAAAARGGLELEGYRFARDGAAVIVHPSNPVENVAVPELSGIYEGKVDDWRKLGGGPGRIEPVIPGIETDVTNTFIQQALGGRPIRAAVVYEDSDSGVVAAVARRPRAIGFVSLAAVREGVKVLRLSSLAGLPYWVPDAESVYRGEYPLTRFFNLYVRPTSPKLASGVITFITSIDGQRFVQDAGLVPTGVQVRFVRRSSMRGAH